MKDQNRSRGPKHITLMFRYDRLEDWICKLPSRVANPLLAAGEKVRMVVCSGCGGHLPVNDQCNKPAHRFCLYCQKPTPNAVTAPGH